MFYSVNYKSDFMDQADEIRCPVNQLGLIYGFIKDNPDKRYVVQLMRYAEDDQLEKVMEQVKYIIAAGADYTIACNTVMEVKYLINEGYNAFYETPVSDWELFNKFVYELKCSDVWIDGALGFQTKELEAASNDVIIRAAPYRPISGAKGFFIRPEDVHLYDKAIHVIELDTDTKFKIYKRGIWNQDIHLLIDNLPSGIINSMITPEFGERRLNCGQRCMVPNRHCHYCDTELSIVKRSIELLVEDNKDG